MEAGIIDVADEDFKPRFDKATNEKKIASERVARTKRNQAAETIITPRMIAQFSDLMRKGLKNENTKFQTMYISTIVSSVRVQGNVIKILGKSNNLINSVQAELDEEEVPERIQEWRTRQDSNL